MPEPSASQGAPKELSEAARVLVESRAVPGRLSRRGQCQTQHRAAETERAHSVAGRFGPYRAGEGPVALHDALCLLMAGADLTVGTASHRLAPAATDLIPDKAGFTSTALVGSLQGKPRGISDNTGPGNPLP